VGLAESGEVALQKYVTFKPDVVTLDLGMPGGMSGYDTLSKIKEIERGKCNQSRLFPMITPLMNVLREGQQDI